MRPLYLFLLIIFLGVFLRFFGLHHTPPGLYPDEAMNGVDAIRALDRADFQVFYPNNNGREGLFINLQALSIQMFGPSAWALRAVGATMGSLTLLFFALLALEIGQRLFPRSEAEANSKRFDEHVLFALLATFLLAVSAWHIHFSRMGFRAIMLPLLSSAAFYYLLKGLRKKKLRYFSFAGISFGLALYTYIASRVVPLIAIVPFVADFLSSRAELRFFARRWSVAILFFLVTLMPLAGYFIAHPQEFIGRAGNVSIFATDNPLKALAESAGKTLLMFNIRGDSNWRHNVSGSPQLDLITGLFFLIGLFLALYGVVRRGQCLVWGTVLLWFALLLLPVITTAEGVPHALRAIGVIPPVFLLAAAGGMWLWRFMRRAFPASLAQNIALIALTLILLTNTQKYFLVWAGNPNVPGAYRADLVTMTNYLKEHEDQTRYVIVNENGTLLDGVPVPSATIRFLTADDPTIHYLTPETVGDITPDYDHTIIIPTAPPSSDLEDTLRSTFPSIQRDEQNGIILYRL